jgi:outer membrane protein TolC
MAGKPPRLILFILVCWCSSLPSNVVAQTKGLDYFLEQARSNSPAGREAQNALLSARIDSLLLRASLLPQVQFLAAGSYAPIVNGWGYDEAITNIANLSGIFQANRNFLSKSNIAAQIQAIDLQRRALRDSLLLTQQDLAKSLTDQYITAYADQVAADLSRELYTLMQHEDTALKRLTEQSVFRQTDYLAFFITMQQQELTALQAEIQYSADFLTLNYLSGIVDTTIFRLAQPGLPDTLADFTQTVFNTRFTTDSLRIANEGVILGYQYRPKIGAYTDAGYQSSLQVTPWKNFGFSFGLSLAIPIYDGHQRRLKEQQIGLREKNRLYNREFYTNQYRMQTAQLRKQLRSIDLLLAKLRQQIEYSRTLVEANGKLLQTGDITVRDYVAAINNYLNAQNLLTQNTISRLKVLSSLNFWNLKPSP